MTLYTTRFFQITLSNFYVLLLYNLLLPNIKLRLFDWHLLKFDISRVC